MGFRLLTELYSFLHAIADTVVAYNVFKFPSPYGVSFILMIIRWKFVYLQEKEFPSPYGVIFILTRCGIYIFTNIPISKVSVSLRSIIHSYTWNDDYFYIDGYGNLFPSPYGVSFILIRRS